jgi:hypothetical protein
MVTLPGATPLTVPEVEPIVAIVPLLLVHVPPPTALLKLVVAPTHTDVDMGDIAAGAETTVTALPTAQEPRVYEIFAVPTPAPVTVPPITVAIAPLLLLHTPPGVASVSTVVPPKQTDTGVPGLIATGVVFTVTVDVVVQVPIA